MKRALYHRAMKIGIYRGILLLFCLGIFSAGCGRREESDNSVSYHLGMAKAFYRRGKYWPAIEMYEKALAMDSDCAEAYLQLGIIYDDNLKDKTRAVACYRKYLKLSPDSEMSKMVHKWIKKSRNNITVADAAPGTSPPPPAATSGISSPAPASTPPPAPVPPPAAVRSARNYRVKGGDTLAALAGRFYGDRQAWKKIYRANRDRLASPDQLKEGQLLVIPPR